MTCPNCKSSNLKRTDVVGSNFFYTCKSCGYKGWYQHSRLDPGIKQAIKAEKEWENNRK